MTAKTDARAAPLVQVGASARSPTPEPESRRGRPRDRSLSRYNLTAVNHGGTGESCTLRGRSRRRSTSPYISPSSRQSSRTEKPKAVATSLSPTRNLFIRVFLKNRHRSQSPSRSRSPNSKVQKARRRQRTRSRGRTHQQHEPFRRLEQLSTLRNEMDHSQISKGQMNKQDDLKR
jgi:hypothetical protein